MSIDKSQWYTHTSFFIENISLSTIEMTKARVTTCFNENIKDILILSLSLACHSVFLPKFSEFSRFVILCSSNVLFLINPKSLSYFFFSFYFPKTFLVVSFNQTFLHIFLPHFSILFTPLICL